MTLTDVGDHFGMVASGVAYYFPSKEELSAACFLRSVEAHKGVIADAARETCVEDRLCRLFESYFTMRKRIAKGDSPVLAQFDDVRALGDKHVTDAYVQMFRDMRQLLAPLLADGQKRSALNARTHLLLNQFMWVEAWLPLYDPDDYDRVADRVADIALHGFGTSDPVWSPRRLEPSRPALVGEDDAHETFLRAATQLINEIGYLGASVERIAAKLDVTKGAFYHHIDAKDDLVAICFARTTEAVRRAQKLSDQIPISAYSRLSSILTSLVQHSLEGDTPLLRGATVSLPEAIRSEVMAQYEHNAVRFGSIVSDGIVDGSIRPLDAQIGSHMLNACANAIGELIFFLPTPIDPNAAEDFVRPMFEGLTCALNRSSR